MSCNRFKVVENEDGSTGVYSFDRRNLICLVPAKKHIAVGSDKLQCERKSSSSKPDLPSSSVSKPTLFTPCDKQTESSDSKLQRGQQVLTEIQLGSPSSEYNLRHLTNRKESRSKQEPSLSPLPSECLEAETEDISDDCLTDEDFFRCVSLISHENLKTNSLSELQQTFPLRKISKTSNKGLWGSQKGTDLSNVDICSPIGQRVLQSSQHILSEEMAELNINKYEKFCHTLQSSFDDVSSTPQLRCRDNLRRYPVTFKCLRTWPSNSVHTYSFSKRQRLEQYKTSCSGLNKRGRWLKSMCKKLTVVAKRLSLKEISEIKRELKKNTPESTDASHSVSEMANHLLHPVPKAGASGESNHASLISGASKEPAEVKNCVHKVPLSAILENSKPSNKMLLPHVHYSLPKTQMLHSSRIPIPVNSKANGAFLKLPHGTTYKISTASRLINFKGESRDAPVLGISSLDVKGKTISVKYSSTESGTCLIPLQDVVQKIWKVGDKWCIKGTSIKACGIAEQRENMSCVNNAGSASSPNLNHDHAYHRSPAINPIRPVSSGSEYGKTETSIKAAFSSQPNILSENCPQYRLPNGCLLPSNENMRKSMHVNSLECPLQLSDQNGSQPLSSHVLNNKYNISNRKPLKSKKHPSHTYLKTKSNNKQIGKNIPLIDITDDSADESSSPKTTSSVKWVFHCYGCGFFCTRQSQEEVNETVLKHMRIYHFVTDPASFLSSYFKSSERAVVTEAFPGYKNSKT